MQFGLHPPECRARTREGTEGRKDRPWTPFPSAPARRPAVPTPLIPAISSPDFPLCEFELPPPSFLCFQNQLRNASREGLGRGGASRISTHDPKTERQCPHTLLILVSNLPQGLGNQIHSAWPPGGSPPHSSGERCQHPPLWMSVCPQIQGRAK